MAILKKYARSSLTRLIRLIHRVFQVDAQHPKDLMSLQQSTLRSFNFEMLLCARCCP